MGNTVWHIGNTYTYSKVTLDSTGSEYLMIHVKIVEEDKLLLESFEEQINKVINEIEDGNLFSKIKDIKVMNEDKVMIIYNEWFERSWLRFQWRNVLK